MNTELLQKLIESIVIKTIKKSEVLKYIIAEEVESQLKLLLVENTKQHAVKKQTSTKPQVQPNKPLSTHFNKLKEDALKSLKGEPIDIPGYAEIELDSNDTAPNALGLNTSMFIKDYSSMMDKINNVKITV